MNGTFARSAEIAFGNTAEPAFERPFAGRSQRSEMTVWSTHTRTVSRKLPTISATATIIPIASESAAEAIEVRRSEAGIDAEASSPTMPNIARYGVRSRFAIAVTIIGASAEKPATTKRTAMYPATAIPFHAGNRESSAAMRKQVTAIAIIVIVRVFFAV